MTITINGTDGITTPEVTLDNTSADGGQVVLKSSGYSNWNLDNYSGRIRAYYGSTEYFTINTSGNVGIGTSSPTEKLTVSSSSGTPASFRPPAGGYNGLEIFNGTNGVKSIGFNDAAQSTLAIYQYNSSGNFVREAMRIDSSGNVGIGTSSTANARLTVFEGSQPMLKLASSASGTGATDGFDLVAAGTTAYIYNRENGPMLFATNNTEQMRIDSSGVFYFNSGYGSSAKAYGCRAWVNFNGTGTVAIRASGNVSSITDNGTGDYTVNFSTAMPDANYCAVVPTSPAIGVTLGAGAWFGGVATDGSGVPLTKNSSSVRVRMAQYNGPGGSYDTNETNVAIFR